LFHWAWARATRLLPIFLIVASIQTVGAATPATLPGLDTAAKQATVQRAAQAAADSNSSSAAERTTEQLRAITTLSPSREIFGFGTAGSLGDPTFGYSSWNFNLLSTVAFFAIHVTWKGILVADSNWTVWNSTTLTDMVATAHAHGVKVVVTIVGPHTVLDQCASLYWGGTTVAQIVAQVQAKGIDGVNIDYEGQLANCTNITNITPIHSNQWWLTNFAKQMRAGLDAVRPGYYLSIDTYSGSAAGNDGYFNIPDLNQYVDSFFVMAYDMDYANALQAPLSCSGRLGLKCLSPVSPLTTYYYNDTLSMSQYASVVGAGKTILGQPYYGRVACVASPVAHASPTSNLSAATYLEAIAIPTDPDVKPGTFRSHRDANDPTGRDRWDTWYDNALHCWREMYWSDVTQLGARYNLVNQMNLRGVGFWTLNYGGGSPALWNALQAYFVSCTNAGVSANPASPQLAATQVQVVATSNNCNVPLYEFWFLRPGGTWTLAQRYSSSPNFYWNTAGKPAGTYRFSVWARAAQTRGLVGTPPNTYDSFSTLSYVLTTAPCTATTVSASPASTTTVGTQVAITGAATGCPNPRYEFWIRPPGHAWSLAKAYSSTATFTWNTIGRTAGTYLFSVWAKDTSSLGTAGTSPNTYDSFGSLSYPLTWPACTAMSETEVPPATAAAATTVTITGLATGCPKPLYEFWMRPPGGAWTLVRPYSTSAAFSWNTTAKRAGAYSFSVWARDANGPGTNGTSPNTYDVFSVFVYTLTTSPCTASSASSSPASTATVGTPVTITGSATGCPNAQYEFWLLPPGGAWTLVQRYSSIASFNWTTAGEAAGTYLVSVWARDASSLGTGGTAPNTYDAFSPFQYGLS
jgi:hypothetical protein